MDLVTFSLPGLAGGCQHGGFSRTSEPDHGSDVFWPGNMRNRLTLFVRQSRWGIACSRRSAKAFANRVILLLYRSLDMARIDAMGIGLMQPLGRSRHAQFEIDHVPCRIALIGNLARLRIDALSLKFHERWRRHDSRKGVLEHLRVIVDVAMQGFGNIMSIEHALLTADQ